MWRLPFLSWGRCRCLCTAETSPARPWQEPAWCASPPPPWEPDTPLGSKTPPGNARHIDEMKLTHVDQDTENWKQCNCKKWCDLLLRRHHVNMGEMHNSDESDKGLIKSKTNTASTLPEDQACNKMMKRTYALCDHKRCFHWSDRTTMKWCREHPGCETHPLWW